MQSFATPIAHPHHARHTPHNTMPLKHNEYYEGNVHSIGFERTGLPASVG
jgi:hypothetical protein